jgi:DNA-binding NtrC family response regulator
MDDKNVTRSKLLLVDDDVDFLEDATAVLSRDFDCVGVSEPDEVVRACDVEDPDAVLLDLDFHGEPVGFELLGKIKAENPFLTVIMWTETEDVHARLRAQELGAFYYVHKAARPGDVVVVIDAALRKNRAMVANRAMRAELDRAWGSLIYASDEMKDVVDTAARVAETDSTVLITGDTGVGKGVIAYEIHKKSARASQEFMVVECAGITEHLADNELFGHEKGAFTGAYRREPGVCHAADHGTLFLDEVGDMPPTIQAKIRRLVEESKVRRVGATVEKNVDIRVLAATNRNLEEDVKTERFRQDLFYRLNTIRIHIPPLKKRRSDIRPLAGHFLGMHMTPDGSPFELSPDAVFHLENQEWPGNVRELKHAIDRACILSAGPVLTADSFKAGLREEGELLSWAQMKAGTLADLERDCIVRALARGGNVAEAARLLQVSRSFVHAVIKRRAIRDVEWKKVH